MWAMAYAQTAQSPSGPSALVSFIPLVLVFVVFYLLLILPQQKKAKQQREMLEKLKKNDEVMTASGIYGKVVALTDTVVTLEVAPNVRLRVHRPHISTLIKTEKSSVREAKEP
ncbi:MAG TPA: preprotein translocase subunit YajC [Candidatus Binatia bacterium]|jgi:preprotein translocase subunit YajC|nr:preprotein translocase subunit YajC [Candidatus Binatia bacterium]